MSRKKKLKMPVTRESGIPIRFLPHRKKKPWMLDVYKNGVRTRTCFASQEEAQQAAMREAVTSYRRGCKLWPSPANSGETQRGLSGFSMGRQRLKLPPIS